MGKVDLCACRSTRAFGARADTAAWTKCREPGARTAARARVLADWPMHRLITTPGTQSRTAP